MTNAFYSSIDEEYRVICQACGLWDRSARGKLRLTGAERLSFLHRMTSNDVERLAPGHGTYALALTAQGRIVCDLRILPRGDDLLLDVAPGCEKTALAHLDRHLISEDAEISDVTSSYALFSFVGPRAPEAVSALMGAPVTTLEEHQLEERNSTLLVGTRLAGEAGVDLFVPVDQARALVETALAKGREVGLQMVGVDAMEIRRVEAGIPRWGVDVTEETPPVEAFTDRTLSATKGCYLGQEAIARATHRSVIRRKLAGFRLDTGPLLPRGTLLFKAPGETKPAGEVTTAVSSPRFGAVALGYARREHHQAGTDLWTNDGRKVTVATLPFF